MTLEDLKTWIRENRINPIYASIGRGLPGPFEQMCIVKEGDRWEVYFVERTDKLNLRTFDTEDEACRHFVSVGKSLPKLKS
jgi:hypothetical protein